jgi:hypothetical protein
MRAALCLALGLALAACRHEASPHDPAPAPSAHDENAEISVALAELERDEAERRARTDFTTLAPSSRSFGANPYALAALDASRFVGILRGDSRVVLLDDTLTQTSALATAPSPSALATAPGGHVFVAGPLAAKIERFRVTGGVLAPNGAVALPNGVVLRALAADPKTLVAADFVGDRLYTLPISKALAVPANAAPPLATATCQGPVRLALSAHYLAVACLFEHAIVVYARNATGNPEREAARIVHDGPLWSVALLEHGDELAIAAGGVEDHPLERRDRVFGYVDSFVYRYALEHDGRLVRKRAENTSALGVVVPKAVALREHAGQIELLALGYATSPLVTFAPDGSRTLEPALPGCAALVVSGERVLCPNPLFDAWVELGAGGPKIHPARAPAPNDPPANARLGEALFFTTLMAPDAQSDGRLSRFTCETCHFEGATDGRVHNSGRHAFDAPDDVRVSTRPLFGLFNDAPHFSRAHDRDLTSVCNNEFTVANRGNPVDPWFSLDTARFPWLAALGERSARLSPVELRRALFEFLARFSHEENPFVAGHEPPQAFTQSERSGAEAFRSLCARCHAARLVANDGATLVPFERWEALIFSPSTPLVWARGEYERTGVLPYVDREGTRIPSLRRLYLKRPYFTNGSARSLAEVLERARYSSSSFFHTEPSPPAPGLTPIAPDAQRALLDFLKLL